MDDRPIRTKLAVVVIACFMLLASACTATVKRGGQELSERYPNRPTVVKVASQMSRAAAANEVFLSQVGETVADFYEQCLGRRSIDPEAECLVEREDALEMRDFLDEAQPAVDAVWGAIVDYLDAATDENLSKLEAAIKVSNSWRSRAKNLAREYGVEVP